MYTRTFKLITEGLSGASRAFRKHLRAHEKSVDDPKITDAKFKKKAETVKKLKGAVPQSAKRKAARNKGPRIGPDFSLDDYQT